jgi:hypothetical protein
VSADEGYEHIEVPVQKVAVNITLDDLLNALGARANSLASAPEANPPGVVDRLNQLIQLAQELKGRV